MGAVVEDREFVRWTPSIIVNKWSPATTREMEELLGRAPGQDDFIAHNIEPDDVAFAEGNILVTVGLQRLGDLFSGASALAFNATRGMAGVGDSATAAAVGQTALQGTASTGQFYVPINGAPSSVNGLVSFAANYTGTEANYIWNEWCMAIATAAPVRSATFATATTSGIMLNRKVQNLGTKANGATWTLNGSIQFA